MGKEIHKAENRRNPKTVFSAARPKQPLEPQLLKPIGSLHDDDDYKDCLMEHGVLSGKAQHVSLTRVKLQGMRFDAALPSLELEDVLFEGCDLSNAVFSDSFLLRVAFLNCRMIGVDLSGATLRDTEFNHNVLQYANFRFSRLKRALFDGCNCSEADFSGMSLEKIQFLQTDLRKVQMSGTPLANIDFTSCEIDGLGARPEDLRGAVFSPEQAITAAKILGVEIRF